MRQLNLLKHHIKEIKSVKECNEDWTKIFKQRCLDVIVIADCCGDVKEYDLTFTEEQWGTVEEQGYFVQ